MSVEFRLLEPGEASVLDHVAEGVFDRGVDHDLCTEFLNDSRHHLAVAIDDGVVIGMASAVDYIHPDKTVELWINEVGVSPDRQRSGIGRRLVNALLEKADELGCREVWVAAERDDAGAQKFYSSLGGDADPLVMYTFRRRGPSDS